MPPNQQETSATGSNKPGIAARLDCPHSIIDEVFSWDRTLNSRD